MNNPNHCYVCHDDTAPHEHPRGSTSRQCSESCIPAKTTPEKCAHWQYAKGCVSCEYVKPVKTTDSEDTNESNRTGSSGYSYIADGTVRIGASGISGYSQVKVKTTPNKDSWEKEFKEKFGYAGGSGSFTGIRDDEIIRFIRETRTAARESALREALEVAESFKHQDPLFTVFNDAQITDIHKAINRLLDT